MPVVKCKCMRCGDMFEPEEIEDGWFQDKLCYHCFEEGVEEHEERRRERIARENEY